MQTSQSQSEAAIRRALLDSNARPYTRQRIEDSFEAIDATLAIAEPFQKGAAIDIGCGAGYDTFALVRHFKQVCGVDADQKAVREAQRIARLAQVSNIEFVMASIDHWVPADRYDFALCNLMSHNVASRVKLIESIVQMMKREGAAVYSDECEGYAPMEIHRAILSKDKRALVARLHQLLFGFVGGTGFRFFIAGSARPIFERLGCEVSLERRSLWNGIATTDFLVVRNPQALTSQSSILSAQDSDYAPLAGDFSELRARFVDVIEKRPNSGLTAGAREDLKRQARESSNRFAPFLLHLAMADLVLSQIWPVNSRGRFLTRVGNRLEASAARLPGPLERICLCALRVAGIGSPEKEFSWDAVSELDREFIEIARRRAGLENGIED